MSHPHGDGELPALPASAIGHVAGRRESAYRETMRAVEPDAHDDPIDTYCGPVWVGGLCIAVLGSLLCWGALVALVRWIGGAL